jgi:hypothetical protein
VRLRNYFILLITVTASCVGLLFASLFITSPAKLGPFGVTFWFVLLFTALSGVLAGLIYLVKHLLGPTEQPTRRLQNSLRQAALVGGWLTIILALSSLKQLNPRDVLLSLLMIVLIEIYFNLR